MSAVIEAPPRLAAAAAPVVAAPPPLLQQEPEQPNGTAPSTSGRQQASSQASTAAAVQTGSRYCCYFVHRLLDFRVPELRALAELFGVQQQQLAIEPIPEAAVYSGSDAWPLRMVTLPDDSVAAQIAGRSVLLKVGLGVFGGVLVGKSVGKWLAVFVWWVWRRRWPGCSALRKGIFDVWGEGDSFEAMCASIVAHPAFRKAAYTGADSSFKVVLSTVGFKWRPEQYRHYVHEVVQAVGFEGPVELEAPQHTFWVVTVNSDGEAGMPEMPTRWVFGRQVALGDRSFLGEYALPQRAYIGPTSMDPELAFIMTNMAQVTPRCLVMDPYVGTGSILVAAAARGAATFGADIDHRVVMAGKSHPTTGARLTVTSNYEQYGLTWPVGLVRMDVHRHPFRTGLTEVFDAILGDPPYGVRAGGRKSKCKPGVLIRNRETYIPSTAPYSLTECLGDLLELAAALLVTGGRLVFWMPSNPELYSEQELPTHPMLQLLDNSEQILTGRYSRRLISMVKTRPYDAAVAAEWRKQREGYVMALERLSELVYAGTKEEAAAIAAAGLAAATAAGGGGSNGGEAGEQQQEQQQQQVIMLSGIPKYRGKNC